MHPRLQSGLTRARAAGPRIGRLFRGRIARRILIVCAVLAGLYALLGFVVLPAYLHPKLEQAYATVLRRDVRIGDLYFNPFALSMALRDVRVAQGRASEGGSTEPLFTAEEFYANIALGELLRGVPVLESVRLVRPHAYLQRGEDRRYNIQDLIDEWRNSRESEPAMFALNDLEVEDGAIDFDDRVTGERHSVTALHLGVPFLSSLPDDADVRVQPSLSVVINGAPLKIQGETTPFQDAQETVLRMRLDKMQAAKYLDYLPLRLHFELGSGQIDGELQLKLSTAQGRLKTLQLSGTALLQDVELRQLSGDRIVALPSARIALESYDFVSNQLLISHLVLERPDLRITRYKDGRLNLVALSAAPIPTITPTPRVRVEQTTAQTPRPPFRFRIRESEVHAGSLQYRDLYNSGVYIASLKNIQIGLQNIGSGQEGAWQAAFDSDSGEGAKGQGKLGFAPVKAEGNLQLKAMQIKRFLPLYADHTRMEIRDGLLSGETRFHFASGESGGFRLENMQAVLQNGQLGVSGDHEATFVLPQLSVRDGLVDFGERRLQMGELTSQKGKGRILRLKDGRLQWAGLSKKKEDPQAESRPWKAAIGSLAIRNFALDFEDQATARPVKLSATYIDLIADKFSSEAASQISLKAMINKTGTLAINGPLSLSPLRGTLETEARGIDLVQFEPYWSHLVNFDLKRGRIGTRGRIEFDRGENASVFNFHGNLRAGDVHATDRETQEDLLKWRSLFIRNFNFQSAPFKAAIERVILSDFYSRLVLRSDGKLNVQSLRAQRTSENEESKPAPVPEAPKRVVQIGGIELREGRVSFADYFVKPNYSAELNKVAGTISEMNPEKAGQVDIRAALNGNAPVSVEGLINPLSKDLFLDLHASAHGVDLPALSPYTIKYAGYGIERGKLSFKVHYLLENRQLTAENELKLDQLMFAERRSEDGPDLPVHLAVALLKDRNGVINVNLPISGSLDDPQFSMGGLIARMFVNLILKAVTAPFALIGSIFGGGGEELAYVEFEPGGSALDDNDKQKLDKLATALRERPELKLDIAGQADPASDRDALRREIILRQMKAQKAAETGAKNPEEIQIGENERSKYLSLVYKASDITKPRNFIGIPQDIPPAEMETLLMSGTVVEDDKLGALANTRSQAARDWLISREVPADRIYLLAPRIDSEAKEGAPSRAEFKLR